MKNITDLTTATPMRRYRDILNGTVKIVVYSFVTLARVILLLTASHKISVGTYFYSTVN